MLTPGGRETMAPSYRRAGLDERRRGNVSLMGDARTIGEAELKEMRWAVQLSEAEEEYVTMRSQGRTPLECIETMDRMWNVERSRKARQKMAEIMENETELARLQAMGIEHMSDAQFRAFKDNILMQIARHPTPNASSSIKAIEAVERQRDEEKFGTQEAVKKTLAECKIRMEELDALEAWARAQVPGKGSATMSEQG